MITLTLRDQVVTVSAAGDGDVSLSSKTGHALEWELTENEWFEVLAAGQAAGHETDFWAYKS